MKEVEINTLFDITADPIKNVYDTVNRDGRLEIERIIRIFEINKNH